MGHDIVVGDAGSTDTTYADAELAISFNLSAFSDYWHIGDFHGHPGRLIARRLKEVLQRLKEEGFTPDTTVLNRWGQIIAEEHLPPEQQTNLWEDFKTNPEHERLLKNRFAATTQYFLKIAKQYPDSYWYSDQIWVCKKLYDHEGIPANDSD